MNTNTIIIIIAIITFLFVLYYINNKDPVKNSGSISDSDDRAIQPHTLNNRTNDDISENIVDELIMQYNPDSAKKSDDCEDDEIVSPSDPMASKYGSFKNYGTKRHINLKKIDDQFCEDKSDLKDSRDFSYKKKKFTRRTPEDIQDQFDVDKMLPQEIEADWFDTVPLQSAKKVKGTQLIHPKVHMGVNTVSSSLKNASLDLRGDIPCPKMYVGPFNNSSYEPDTNIRGIFSSV